MADFIEPSRTAEFYHHRFRGRVYCSHNITSPDFCKEPVIGEVAYGDHYIYQYCASHKANAALSAETGEKVQS